MKIFRFAGFDCSVVKDRYCANKQCALLVVAADTQHNRDQQVYPGEPLFTASVCFPDLEFSTNETAIKDYSENEGILAALLKHGIVEKTANVIRSGYVEIPIVKIV